MEEHVAALWAKVLGRTTVPPDANFFELGGDSIRAARLLGLTRQALGRTITLSQLFNAPTLAAMSALLHGGAETPPPGVIWVQPKGSCPPIFAINNTGIFYTLSRHLGSDQPLAAVQALDPTVSPTLHPTEFGAMAARYVDAIRQVRPRGPYILLGLCAAGKVAFEVAQQLQTAGERVDLLAVVDSWAPGSMLRMTRTRRWLAEGNVRWVRLLRQFQRIGNGTLSIRGFIANRGPVRQFRNAVFERLRRAGLLHGVPPGVQNNLFINYLDQIGRDYVPPPLYRPRARLPRPRAADGAVSRSEFRVERTGHRARRSRRRAGRRTHTLRRPSPGPVPRSGRTDHGRTHHRHAALSAGGRRQMRPLEALLISGATAAIVRGSFRPDLAWPDWAPLMPIAIAVLLALHLIFEGWRPQMMSAYAVTVLLLLLAVIPVPAVGGSLGMLAGWAGVCLLAAAGCLGILQPVILTPAPTGAFAVGTTVAPLLADAASDGPVFRLWYPAKPQSGRGLASYLNERRAWTGFGWRHVRLGGTQSMLGRSACQHTDPVADPGPSSPAGVDVPRRTPCCCRTWPATATSSPRRMPGTVAPILTIQPHRQISRRRSGSIPDEAAALSLRVVRATRRARHGWRGTCSTG